MSMKPDLVAPEENVTEINLDGPDAEDVKTGDADEDQFNGENILDDEKDQKIMEAFGLKPEDVKEEVDPDEKKDPESDEDKPEVTETPEEKEAKEKESKEDVKEPVTIDWESEENPYKRDYNASAREVNEVLLPAKVERDALLAEKASRGDWEKERDEIRGILRSNPELTKMFLEQSEVYVPAPTEKPAKVSNEIDPSVIDAAVERKLGPAGLKAIEDAKAAAEKETMDAIGAFETAHPGLTREEKGIIATQTAILQSTLKLPLNEALERSFKATYPEKANEAERREMEEAARVRAAKRDGAVITTTGASHSQGSKPAAPQLTAKEIKIAKAFKLTPEEIVAGRDTEE